MINDIPDDLPDTSAWHDCPCPTCGEPARTRTTNLRAVAATGDETVAGQEWQNIFFAVEVVAMRDGDRYMQNRCGWWAHPKHVSYPDVPLSLCNAYPTLADAMAAAKAWRERGAQVSYSSRRAVAGMIARTRKVHDNVQEAVRRFDAAKTDADVRAVMAWARQQDGWELRDSKHNALLQRAHARAKQRTEGRMP